MRSQGRNRHETIGVKQVIRLEWMNKVANLLLAGLDAKAIRQELHAYLADRNPNGSDGERSARTRTFVIGNLMRIWAAPDPELIRFRDASLAVLRENPSAALAVQWGMISAAYPFWFNVARHTGRLLALQDQVTLAQIINRLREQYGDRTTVRREGQRVMRSFVAWGVLRDSATTGCYERVAAEGLSSPQSAALLLEAAIHAGPDGKAELTTLLSNPGLFPFRISGQQGQVLAGNNARLTAINLGVDESLIMLRKQ